MQMENVSKAELQKLRNKYDKLLAEAKEMCRRFVGPHSVLQVFLEKIISSIAQIADTLKEFS